MKIIFTLLSFIFCCSCTSVHNRIEEKKFSSDKITEIKTNGYYFETIELKPSTTRDGGSGIVMRIFIENGYTFYVGTDNSDQCGTNVSLNCNIENTEKLLHQIIAKGKTSKRNVQLWNWGKFDIDERKITIQYYYNFHGDYYLIEETGEIIDSTSFKLLTEYDYRTKERKITNKIFHFKEYNISEVEKLIPEKL